MSDEMARKKQEDLEQFHKMKEGIAEEVQNDRCPNCGTPSLENKYFDAKAMAMFQWIECNVCGTVYCPESIRKRKMRGSSPIEQAETSPIIVAG
jgi:uncharacterized protein with PIN domain